MYMIRMAGAIAGRMLRTRNAHDASSRTGISEKPPFRLLICDFSKQRQLIRHPLRRRNDLKSGWGRAVGKAIRQRIVRRKKIARIFFIPQPRSSHNGPVPLQTASIEYRARVHSVSTLHPDLLTFNFNLLIGLVDKRRSASLQIW